MLEVTRFRPGCACTHASTANEDLLGGLQEEKCDLVVLDATFSKVRKAWTSSRLTHRPAGSWCGKGIRWRNEESSMWRRSTAFPSPR
jgi:hypothetical protein